MIENTKISKYKPLVTVIAIVFIGFYASGLYRNILEIKKLKKEK